MRRILIVAVVGLVGLFIAQVKAQAPKQSPNFTGGEVTPVTENNTGAIVKFHFAPGARTKWHSHSIGQIILVEQGVAHVQIKGHPVVELSVGQTYYVGPGEVHWHGAAPDRDGTQFNVTRGENTWLGEVTEEEFRAKPTLLKLP